MNQTQRMADSYRAATIKAAWYGPSLAELIAEISPDLATTPPTSGAHSVSALLQHLLLWNERTRNVTASNPMPRWRSEAEWAEPPIPWNELVARWNQSRDLLEEKTPLPNNWKPRKRRWGKFLNGPLCHQILRLCHFSHPCVALQRTSLILSLHSNAFSNARGLLVVGKRIDTRNHTHAQSKTAVRAAA